MGRSFGNGAFAFQLPFSKGAQLVITQAFLEQIAVDRLTGGVAIRPLGRRYFQAHKPVGRSDIDRNGIVHFHRV